MGTLPGVAVQKLNPRHRDDIARHLLRLPAEDRRLRFGRAIRDQAIGEYVAGIDLGRDRAFGVSAPDLALIGVAHLALDRSTGSAELGLSVDPASRGRGYGYALLQRAVLHAANRGFRALFMYCLAENHIMIHLARKAGLTVVVERGEVDARLALDRSAHGGALQEAIADQIALVDCLLKQQYLWLARPGLKSAATEPGIQEIADERRGIARIAEAIEGKVSRHT
ncbi:MAG: GNAT family N-acetyltransferase [Betaproteobacteria bacterium]|nr:GNAT family N-acetyltransferase [Betaproteobacteria bacterium]